MTQRNRAVSAERPFHVCPEAGSDPLQDVGGDDTVGDQQQTWRERRRSRGRPRLDTPDGLIREAVCGGYGWRTIRRNLRCCGHKITDSTLKRRIREIKAEDPGNQGGTGVEYRW
jgi:hypothetical protein